MRKLLGFSLIAFLLTSCTTTYLPYSNNYPLRPEVFLARDSSFTGRVPDGWFYSSEDTLATAYLAWVVKSDFSAALAVRELHLNKIATERVQKDGLGLLAKISIASQSENGLTVDAGSEPKDYTMHGREYCGYEITGHGTPKRVVVFSADRKYYECTALPTGGNPSSESLISLYTAQQAFLYSLTFD